MMKKLLIMGLLLATALLFTACSGGQNQATSTPVIPSVYTQAPAMEIPTAAPLPGVGSSAEEERTPNTSIPPCLARTQGGRPAPVTTEMPSACSPGPRLFYSTPSTCPPPPSTRRCLPTPPTPPQAGLSFESIAGYEVEDGAADTYILREPASMVRTTRWRLCFPSRPSMPTTKDGCARRCARQAVRPGQAQLPEMEPTNTAERTLLVPGYYADFRGVRWTAPSCAGACTWRCCLTTSC